MASQNYRDLIVWQKAMDMIEDVYRSSRGYPREEIYGLTSQMRRSSVSVASNIAEGQGRGGDVEMVRFLRIAHGSLRELETQVLIAERLGYATAETTARLMDRASEVGRLLDGLIRSKRPD